MAAGTGMEYDVYVDDVRMTSQPADLSHGDGGVLVKRDDHDLRKSEETGEPSLAAAAAPRLCEHACDDMYLAAFGDGPVKDAP